MKFSREDIRVFCKEVLPEYFWELIQHVWVILVGFVFSVLGGLIDMENINVPGWVWWGLIVLSVFIAQFLTWNTARKERDQLRRLNVSQDGVVQLQTYRQQLITMQNQDVASETDYGAWKQRYDDLRTEICGHLEGKFPRGESQSFSRFGSYQPLIITGKKYVSEDHMNYTARVIRDHQWLDRAFQDYSRRKLRPAENGV